MNFEVHFVGSSYIMVLIWFETLEKKSPDSDSYSTNVRKFSL